MILVSDLPYIEDISEDNSILGGSLLGITSSASATGSSAYTFTSTDITMKAKKVTKATGSGTALAIGDDPYAGVDYIALGFDKIKVKERYEEGDNYQFNVITIKAMDRPNK